MTKQLKRSLTHRFQSELSGLLQAAKTTAFANLTNFNLNGLDNTRGQTQKMQGNSKLQQSEAMMCLLLQLEEPIHSPSFPAHFPKGVHTCM